MSFFVKPIWDEEAKVFYSESDIEGLYIEAESLPEFNEIATDIARGVVEANHKPGTVSETPTIILLTA